MRSNLVRSGAAALLACLLAACTATGAVTWGLIAHQNTAVVLAFLDTVYNKHEVDQAFRLYVGPVYRQHDPRVPDGRDSAVKALTRLTHETDPQIRLEVKRTVAQGDLVAVHTRYTDEPPAHDSGRGRAVVDIFRLERGKIVEHWNVAEDIPDAAAQDNAMF